MCLPKKCELLLVTVAVIHTFFGTPCIFLISQGQIGLTLQNLPVTVLSTGL